MFTKIRSFLKSDGGMYLLLGVLSAIVFCLIYGVKVIIPTNTDWLLAGDDLSCHYLGWRAYRLSAWQFPVGMTDMLVYPYATSIIFTDSIPVFALLFKLLSPVLPENFQYFGLWGVMSFVLQGILAGRIINKYSPEKWLTVLSSLLFLLVPVVIDRMFYHTALAGQWILLPALDLIFRKEKYESSRRLYLTAGLLGFLAAGIHIYFILMCGIILTGFLLSELLSGLNTGTVRRCLTVLLIYLLSAGLTVFLFGGFSTGVSAANTGLGYFSFNLNGFFNPQGNSVIFKDRALYHTEQYEGFAYLGAGVIAASVLAVFFFISDRKALQKLKNNRKTLVSLSAVVLLSVMIAMSPVITLGDRLLLEMKLPETVTELWSIFRASGRFIWPAVYIIMLVSVIVIMKCADRRTAFIACAMSLCLQYYDLHVFLAQKNVRFDAVVHYDTLLKEDGFWDALAENKTVRHLMYYSSPDQDLMYSVTDWALDNGKTVNRFYLARSLDAEATKNRDKVLVELPEDTVVIFKEEEAEICKAYGLYCYYADGMIAGFAEEQAELESFEWEEAQ